MRAIAERVHNLTRRLADSGLKIVHQNFFDTLHVDLGKKTADEILARAAKAGINLRKLGNHSVGISLDETTTEDDLKNLCEIFGVKIDTEREQQNFPHFANP